MKNAILMVTDSRKFCDDIWQCENDFNTEQWKGSIDSFADTLQEIYNDFSEDIPDDRLYILGDVINMLRSIDVQIIEEKYDKTMIRRITYGRK